MGARFCAIMSLGDRITGRYDRALSAAFRSYLWISFSLSVNAAWPEPLNFATVLKSRVITQIYPLRSFFSTTSFQNFLLLRSRSFFFQCLPPPLPSRTRVSATIVGLYKLVNQRRVERGICSRIGKIKGRFFILRS